MTVITPTTSILSAAVQIKDDDEASNHCRPTVYTDKSSNGTTSVTSTIYSTTRPGYHIDPIQIEQLFTRTTILEQENQWKAHLIQLVSKQQQTADKDKEIENYSSTARTIIKRIEKDKESQHSSAIQIWYAGKR